MADKLAEFGKEQDPTRVYEALEAIEAAERSISAAERSQALSRRLRFLAALDRQMDPGWDPENAPVRGVPPPPTHGMVYGTGEVDPATISDPAVRTEYERALQVSKDRARWYDVQFQLRRIDERATRFVERFVAERYTRSSADRLELEALLAAAPVGGARRKRLRALLDEA